MYQLQSSTQIDKLTVRTSSGTVCGDINNISMTVDCSNVVATLATAGCGQSDEELTIQLSNRVATSESVNFPNVEVTSSQGMYLSHRPTYFLHLSMHLTQLTALIEQFRSNL